MKDKILLTLSSIKRPGITDLMEWMCNSDFFEAPASTKYHLSRPGGLAIHSWNVYAALESKVKQYDIDVPLESVIIIGLLHDLCKANFYAKDIKRVCENNKWFEKEVYVVKDQFPIGHGEKSVIIASRFISLTIEESLAIRWHMGPWDSEVKLLNGAMQYPIVKATMLADQEATWFMEAE